jgi:hypothetical protein
MAVAPFPSGVSFREVSMFARLVVGIALAFVPTCLRAQPVAAPSSVSVGGVYTNGDVHNVTVDNRAAKAVVAWHVEVESDGRPVGFTMSDCLATLVGIALSPNANLKGCPIPAGGRETFSVGTAGQARVAGVIFEDRTTEGDVGKLIELRESTARSAAEWIDVIRAAVATDDPATAVARAVQQATSESKGSPQFAARLAQVLRRNTNDPVALRRDLLKELRYLEKVHVEASRPVI